MYRSIGSYFAGAIAVLSLMTTQQTYAGPPPAVPLDPGRVHGTIVDVAVSNPASFSTLVTALTAANLVTTLQGKGPFTVFAPTNEAFAKIPAPILNYLLSSPKALTRVLLYHVVAGRNTDLDDEFITLPISTVQGQKVFARLVFFGKTPYLKINNSYVVLQPITTDNGVIYAIDSVLLPQFRST